MSNDDNEANEESSEESSSEEASDKEADEDDKSTKVGDDKAEVEGENKP